MNMRRFIALIIAGVLLTLFAVSSRAQAEGSVALPEDRLATIATIKQLSDYADYNVYSMDVLYDYSIENILPIGKTDTQALLDMAFAEAAPGYDIKCTAPKFGCSAFILPDSDGMVRFGRNYDFKIDTSCMIVRCHPRNGYASVAHAALSTLNFKDALLNEKTKTACLVSPFICLDGINEKGVGIAVLTVDSAPVAHNTGKPVLSTTLLIRLVLDRAASTQEAVELLRNYDMYAAGGRDCHFFITDSTGDSRAVEFEPDSETRQMTVTPVRTITNFYITHASKVQPNQNNGVYGHGKERWVAIESVITENGGTGDNAVAWQALKSAVQEPNPEDITSNTQWSIIYNLTDLSYELVFRRQWETVYSQGITE